MLVSSPSLCLVLVSIITPILSRQHTLYPRQDVPTSPTSAVLSSTTSSFNWWPYPAGGVTSTTSTSMLVPVSVLIPTLIPSSFLSSPTSSRSTVPVVITLSSSATLTSTTHSSAPVLSHMTSQTLSPSTPAPSSDPQSLLSPARSPYTPFWLIPVCLLAGAVVGGAGGWLAWRRCGGGSKDKNEMDAGQGLDKYAWAYTHGMERDHDDKDVEGGVGYRDEYLSPGIGQVYSVDVGRASRRVPSTASTSGAQAERTWVGHPHHSQARKRSGVFVGSDVVRTSTGSNHEQVHERDHDHDHAISTNVRSPLLSQATPVKADVPHDSKAKPLPASPLPSRYSYDDDDDDGNGEDVLYESIRHKSVRRRIWERLGFADGGLGRRDSDGNGKVHVPEGDGRHTWSVGARQERGAGADIGRSLTQSWWGRRKTMKEGRVERWVRGVRGAGADADVEEGGVVSTRELGQEPRHACRHQTPPPLGTPELVLSTLRRVSPSASGWRSHEDVDTPHLDPALSTDAGTGATRSDVQRRSVRRYGVAQRSRGVSLQDPGPVHVSRSGCDSISASQPAAGITRPSSTTKNALSLRSDTMATARSHSRRSHSQRGASESSPTPPSPSSVSRYSATSHAPTLGTLSRSPTRTTLNRSLTRTASNPSPTRIQSPSTASRDLRTTTLTRTAPSSRLTRSQALSRSTPPRASASGNSIDTRSRPLLTRTRAVHTSLHSQRHVEHPTSAVELPVGPSSITSPPLQSALCFDSDGIRLPLTAPTRRPSRSQESPTASASASSKGAGISSKLSISYSHTRSHSAKRDSESASGSTPPNARPGRPAAAAIMSPDSRYGSRYRPAPAPAPASVPIDVPKPAALFTAKDRYLARQNANAKVGMILSRSYSSRNFDERPVSPTMFGAVISEDEELDSRHGEERDMLIFQAEGGEGIEQRLERMRILKH